MRSRLASCSLISALLVGSFALLGGCQSTSKSGAGSSSFAKSNAATGETIFAQSHQFYYYPNSQVYRDCDDDRWLWSEDGGATFQSARALPTEMNVGDEVPFAVFLALDAPATEHRQIAAAYPSEPATTVTVQGASEFPY